MIQRIFCKIFGDRIIGVGDPQIGQDIGTILFMHVDRYAIERQGYRMASLFEFNLSDSFGDVACDSALEPIGARLLHLHLDVKRQLIEAAIAV